HGAVLLALKTYGDIQERAMKLAPKLTLVAAVIAVAFLICTQVAYSDKTYTWFVAILAALAWVVSLLFQLKKREGWAFFFNSITLISAVAFLLLVLFPNVFPSIDNPALSLTIDNASSSPYTLQVM